MGSGEEDINRSQYFILIQLKFSECKCGAIFDYKF